MILLEEVRHIDDQISNHWQTRQRSQHNRFGQLIEIGSTSKTIFAIDIHRIGTAHAFTARATQRERIIDIGFDTLQRIEQHLIGILQGDREVLHIRFCITIWVVTINLKFDSTSHDFSELRRYVPWV